MQTNIGKKLIVKLLKTKNRYHYGMFVAEGAKIVNELLKSNELDVVNVFVREDLWMDEFSDKKKFIKTSKTDFAKISNLETAQGWLAVFKMPSYVNKPMEINFPALVFDTIQDPGNLGTVIRTADWFGIDTIICSKGSVDVFSSKVVQASMGAVARIKVYYTDLEAFFKKFNTIPVYAMTMDGSNIYEEKFPAKAFFLFGNESKGINRNLYTYVTKKITIPNFSNKQYKTESLNVAVSASITMALTKVKK
jgi:TrmH family RNA methyltransferase